MVFAGTRSPAQVQSEMIAVSEEQKKKFVERAQKDAELSVEKSRTVVDSTAVTRLAGEVASLNLEIAQMEEQLKQLQAEFFSASEGMAFVDMLSNLESKAALTASDVEVLIRSFESKSNDFVKKDPSIRARINAIVGKALSTDPRIGTYLKSIPDIPAEYWKPSMDMLEQGRSDDAKAKITEAISDPTNELKIKAAIDAIGENPKLGAELGRLFDTIEASYRGNDKTTRDALVDRFARAGVPSERLERLRKIDGQIVVEELIKDILGKGTVDANDIRGFVMRIPRGIDSSDKKDIEAYISQLVWRTYSSLSTIDEKTKYLDSLTAAGFQNYAEAANKAHEESKTKFKEGEDKKEAKSKMTEVNGLKLSNDAAGMAEIKRVLALIGSDKPSLDALKNKIKSYYRTLSKGSQRWAFVDNARSAMIPTDIVGEQLWTDSKEILEANKETMDDARRIIKEMIGKYVTTTDNPDDLWQAKVIGEIRKQLPIGLSREAEEMLRNEFVKSLGELRKQSGEARAMDKLSTVLVDTVVSQFASMSEPPLHDPYIGGRNALGVDLVLEGNPPRIDLGAIDRVIRVDIINPPISLKTTDPQYESTVSAIFEAVTKQIDGELKDINELQKKIREMDIAERKLNRMKLEQVWNNFGLAAKVVGGGLVLGASIAALPINWAGFFANTKAVTGATGAAMFGMGALMPNIREALNESEEKADKVKDQIADLSYLKTEVARLEAKTGMERAGRKRTVRNWFEENIRGMGPEILDSKTQEYVRTSMKPLQLATI